MTDLDALLDGQPITPPSLTGSGGLRKKCRRHVYAVVDSYEEFERGGWYRCTRCGAFQDKARSRRGLNARKRGNALQAAAAKSAGISNIGALGLPEDAGTSREWLVIQHKSGKGYPRLLDRWLRALTITAAQLRGVVYTETPGPGRKAKRLIVLDYDEFIQWYGEVKP